jgi:hypothetical protein
MEAAPIATPPANRAQAKAASESGSADASEESANRAAQNIRQGFRPKRSPIGPANAAPAIQPTIRLDAAHPVRSAVRLKCLVRNPIAPDTTAVS